MITKNAERIHRCLVNLQTILETDTTLTDYQKESIFGAISNLLKIDLYEEDDIEVYPA